MREVFFYVGKCIDLGIYLGEEIDKIICNVIWCGLKVKGIYWVYWDFCCIFNWIMGVLV